MKSLLLLPLLALGVSAGPSYTECYSGDNLSGYKVFFDNYSPDLYVNGIDNEIDSVLQTGMWIYYENYDYNLNVAGRVYFVHGINIVANFPIEYQNLMSSLRYAGSPSTLNADTITFCSGTSFTGLEYYAVGDVLNFGSLGGLISSMIVTGTSYWTVYTGESFTGSSWCVSSTEQDVGTSGEVLDLGIFPSLTSVGIPDNSLRSVRKGCWTEREAKAPELKVDGRQDNGAWGRLL